MKYDEDIRCCTGYLCPLNERCVRFMNFYAYESKFHDIENELPLSVLSATYDYDTNKCENFLSLWEVMYGKYF